MADKQHIITITPPNLTTSPALSSKLYVTAPPPIQTIAPNNVIDIAQQQQQQVNTSNLPVYCRSCTRFCITVLVFLGVFTSLLLHALLIELPKQNSRDSSAFISHHEKSAGYSISWIAMLTAVPFGVLVLAFLGLANRDPEYPLYFKFLLVAFLFGIVFGLSVLFLQIFATHLAYRVCVGVVLAAYLGGLWF